MHGRQYAGCGYYYKDNDLVKYLYGKNTRCTSKMSVGKMGSLLTNGYFFRDILYMCTFYISIKENPMVIKGAK